jgi:tRNA threonylcarbamoyladenosine biosynthesis protein TsaB
MSTTLVIETVTPVCSVALVAMDGSLLAERHERIGRGHAERLVPMIEELLAGGRAESILVDCGPGSFTGLRVGLAAAHGLAIGWGAELRGYSVMALLAAMAERDGNAVAVALEGGHGQLFVQDFAGDPLRPTDDLRSLVPEAAALVIAPHDVVGSGAASLVAARGFGAAVDLLPRAACALALPPALRSLAPRPMYGRAPDAKPMIA